MAFSTKIKGHHHLQGNVQVYNLRIPDDYECVKIGGPPNIFGELLASLQTSKNTNSKIPTPIGAAPLEPNESLAPVLPSLRQLETLGGNDPNLLNGSEPLTGHRWIFFRPSACFRALLFEDPLFGCVFFVFFGLCVFGCVFFLIIYF